MSKSDSSNQTEEQDGEQLTERHLTDRDSTTVLQTNSLVKKFGGITAVDEVSISVRTDEVLSIIGPNGAGKTTLFNLLTGVYQPTAGTVSYYIGNEQWNDITNTATHKIATQGVVRTFQNARPFSELTVRENVFAALGTDEYRSPSMFTRYKTDRAMSDANSLLERVDLIDYANTSSGELPLALQRRLEIARALALNPSVLLLDEPAAGLNESESQELMKLLTDLATDGLAVVLIEHAMDVVMNISDRIYVLDRGEIIAEGDAEAIQSNDQVKEAYLGESTTKPELGETDNA